MPWAKIQQPNDPREQVAIAQEGKVIETLIPARMDRLPWSKWHWLVITGLGITWVLDGLEVTLAGTVGGVLKQTLHMNDTQVGLSATTYLLGAVAGAIFFGYATDRLGRKKLFTVTLLVYLIATACSALSWNFWSYAIFRCITGMGIGGEYSAINSAIDELIPARVRGQVDLFINATYWFGAAMGAGATVILLNGNIVPIQYGWRLTFMMGALLGVIIIFIRKFIPESPRWLITHGQEDEANETVNGIEKKVEEQFGKMPLAQGKPLRIKVRLRTPWKEVFNAMLKTHGKRSILGVALMVAQAFFYNAIFFTYALVLIRYYKVPPPRTGLYLLPFALGNVLGPLLLGRLFDTVGRKPMIIATYAGSGVLLSITGWMFGAGMLTARTQSLCWTAIFFVASCAASAAYLTVSEVFPLEIRALAISIFYAAGTLIGGVAAPSIFGHLIDMPGRQPLVYGYYASAALMVIAAIAELLLGVKAEGQSLENISSPLSSA
jgi:MFS family permease